MLFQSIQRPVVRIGIFAYHKNLSPTSKKLVNLFIEEEDGTIWPAHAPQVQMQMLETRIWFKSQSSIREKVPTGLQQSRKSGRIKRKKRYKYYIGMLWRGLGAN